MIKKYVLLLMGTIFMVVILSSCSNDQNNKLKAEIDRLQAQVATYKAERAVTARNLKTFDDLDLVAFNNRDMELIKQIHAEIFHSLGNIKMLFAEYAATNRK